MAPLALLFAWMRAGDVRACATSESFAGGQATWMFANADYGVAGARPGGRGVPQGASGARGHRVDREGGRRGSRATSTCKRRTATGGARARRAGTHARRGARVAPQQPADRGAVQEPAAARGAG